MHHLDVLEAEAIHVIREVAAELERPVLLFSGGKAESGIVEYGKRLKLRLPAKRVPEAVERWIRKYEAEREEGEGFNAFVARVGTKEFEDAVRDLAMPVEFGLESMNQFIDWTKKVPFVVQRGEGECAV